METGTGLSRAPIDIYLWRLFEMREGNEGRMGKHKHEGTKDVLLLSQTRPTRNEGGKK
jgi:hypothetical protein